MSERVLLLTRAGCHLCGPARELLREQAAAAGVAWAERDVDADEALRAAYGDYVPVVLVDGAVVGYWRLDERALRRALRAST